MPEFTVGLEKEVKVYGLGEFGVDSYLIFCAGEGRNITPNDKNLRAFTTWLKGVGDDEGGIDIAGALLEANRGVAVDAAEEDAPPPPLFVKPEPA
jgi:hypothetical protein